MQSNLDPQKEDLATELAEKLGELESLELFRSFADRYSEQLLRKTLNDVLSVPSEKIKKSRAALFTYLIKKHARGANHHWA
jgi:hypothetical protein